MLFALRFESDFIDQNLRISVRLFGCRLLFQAFFVTFCFHSHSVELK
jgi:hypothetical protein